MEDKEKYELKLTDIFKYVDEEFKELLEEVCYEIDKFDRFVPYKVWQLAIMPYELAMLIVDNLKYINVYRETLYAIYYDEFKRDVKKKQKKKKSKFELRQLSQKTLDYELFGMERLLTLSEVESLIYLYILDNKLGFSKEDVLSGKVETTDKNLKALLEAHKYLSENVDTTDKIIKEMDKVWLRLTLQDIKNHRKNEGLGI